VLRIPSQTSGEGLMPRITRRDFLLSATAAGAAAALRAWMPREGSLGDTASARAALPAHRVVHVHSDEATTWDYSTGWYGNFVTQSVVDAMTDRGVMTVTNTALVADAWHALLPSYTSGQKVAIKVNLNNALCSSTDNVIDALPQPVNSVICGLKSIGVAESDIWVYDVTHGWHNGQMPSRVVNKVTALYPTVQFHADSGGCVTALGYSSDQKIHFNVPAGKPAISDRLICNALVTASYLINMPIMKMHGMAGITLGFKNHFGSLQQCDLLHWSVTLGDGNYTSNYNVLVDMFNNPHFKNKTVLTIGDGLFGARINNWNEVPSPWASFDNHSPNSLFFSTDPVAIDCVMADFLDAETGVPDRSDDYLKLANAAGLGTYERWDALQQYHTIDYQLIELPVNLNKQVYLPLIRR
jgi:hypothetical protein